MSWSRRITNGVDYAVGLISPRRQARRAHFRRMAESPEYREYMLAMMQARGYRAADASSTKTGWRGAGGSADAQVAGQTGTLRERSRELNRDDPLGSGLTDTFVRNVIGTGMRPQARTGDLDLNKALEAVWRERADSLGLTDDHKHGQHQQVVFSSFLRDGGVLLKEARRTPDEPVWIEIVELDRLDTPLGGKPKDMADPKGSIRYGVEKDWHGVPVAFWVRKGHPGEVIDAGISPGAMVAKWNEFERVDKATATHLRLVDRTGQTLGVPIFHAVLQDLHDLDLLLLAGLKRTQIAACLAAFIKTDADIEDTMDVTARRYGYKLDQTLEPAMIMQLNPSESIETVVPNFPTPELVPFVILLARRIGAAVGVSWQVVLHDFGDSTYSSARTDLLETWRAYDLFAHLFVAGVLNWEWRVVLSDARLRGDSRLAGVTDAQIAAVAWIANGREWVDPDKGARAVERKRRLGLTTHERENAALGADWRETLAQCLDEEREEIDMRIKRGLAPLPFYTNPALAQFLLKQAMGGESGKSSPPRSRAVGNNGDHHGDTETQRKRPLRASVSPW